MWEEQLKKMNMMVCSAPGGNGFTIEHIPEFLQTSSIDDSAPHVHSFYEIIWFREGTGMHTVDFQEYELKPNTIFFLVPGQVHHFDKEHNYKGFCIKMCTDFMSEEEGTSALFIKYNAFHTFDTTPYYTIDEGATDELLEVVSEMEREAERDNEFGNIDILRSLLKIFLVKVQRYGKQEGEVRLDNLKPSHRLFVQFRRLVEQEYMHLHTVQEYADRLNVAVRTLNKSVNECSQKPPLTFINDRIILEAKRQVRYSSLRIKEIAYSLGYEDPSYFVKFFKRQTGFLPTDFREIDNVCHCVIQ